MNLCASCGLELVAGFLCPHHAAMYGDGWAAENRLMCDFIHRKRPLPRLPESERNEPVYTGDCC